MSGLHRVCLRAFRRTLIRLKVSDRESPGKRGFSSRDYLFRNTEGLDVLRAVGCAVPQFERALEPTPVVRSELDRDCAGSAVRRYRVARVRVEWRSGCRRGVWMGANRSDTIARWLSSECVSIARRAASATPPITPPPRALAESWRATR